MPSRRNKALAPTPDEHDALARFTIAQANVKASVKYKRAKALLSVLCLVTGHTRPSYGVKGIFGTQRAVPMPGADDSPVAAEAVDVEVQLRAAFAMEHPCDDMTTGLQPDVCAAADWLIEHRHSDLSQARESRMETIALCARELHECNEELFACAPKHILEAKPPRIHAALCMCLADVMQWPDSYLIQHMVLGCPAVGLSPDSGVFREEDQQPTMEMCDLDHNSWAHSLRNKIRAYSLNAANADEAKTLWERTMKEVHEGWATPIGSKEDCDRLFGEGLWRAMWRFGVLQKGSVRPCDNAKGSLHNACTHLKEHIVCETADWPVRMAAYLVRALGTSHDWGVLLGTEDIEKAYRRAMCSQPQFTVFAQWDPTAEGKVVFFRLQGFNFGLKSAVLWFNRLAEFIQRAAVRYAPLCTGRFFDDYALLEPTFAGQSGRRALRKFADIIGLPFSDDPDKSLALALERTFLGVEYDLKQFWLTKEITTSVSQARVNSILSGKGALSDILRSGTFDGNLGADKIAGMLSFSLGWATNRFGRAALQPLYHYSKKEWGRYRGYDLAVRAALLFFQAMLQIGLPGRKFKLNTSKRKPILVWSDACWEEKSVVPAGIGFVIYIPPTNTAQSGKWYWSGATVGSEFISQFGVKKQYIGQLELLAAVAVYHTVAAHPQLKSQFQGAPVIHFIDNYAAAAGLTKGYSAATASSRVVHAFWALVGAMKCAPWISYIRSKGNIADIPSRMFQPDFDSKDLDVLRCRNAKELKLSMPRVDEWPSMAWAILEASRQADHDESSLRAGGPVAPKRRRR